MVLALALALAGCGDDSSVGDPVPARPPVTASVSASASAATPPATACAAAPTTRPSTVTSSQVAIVSQSAAGGEVSPAATVLSDDAAVRAFGAQYRTPQLGEKLAGAVAGADVPAGASSWAAVIAIGCDVPAATTVSTDGDGSVLVRAEPSEQSGIQCLAPVTSVAVVLVPDA